MNAVVAARLCRQAYLRKLYLLLCQQLEGAALGSARLTSRPLPQGAQLIMVARRLAKLAAAATRNMHYFSILAKGKMGDARRRIALMQG
jgi:hypothetical protein